MKIARGKFDGWTTIAVALTGGYLLMVIWPLVTVLIRSATSEGEFSLAGFEKFFSSRLYYETLTNSLLVTVSVTVLALAIAFPMAYFMTMFRVRGNRTAQMLILASMMSPPFIGAYSWILLLGNNGLITNWVEDTFGIEPPPIYGFSGIVLVLTLQLVPLIFTYLMGAWRTIDVSLLEASEGMGVTGLRRAFKVISPLLWPTVLAGSLLVFVRAFADFGTPILIGQGFRTVPVLIYSSFVGEVSNDTGFAAAVSVIVIIVALIVFLLQKYFVGRKQISMTAAVPIVPKPMPGWRGWLIHLYVYGFLTLALAPLVVVVISSFRNTLFGQFVDGFSFDNYSDSSDAILRYVGNTFRIGLSALFILVIIAVFVSYLTVRRKGALSNGLDTMTMIPYVVPGLVIGIALVTAFSQPPFLLTGTFAIMVLALVIRRMPYSVRSTTAIMYQLDPSIEEAAISLGASKFRTLVRVIVPALAPGILAGAVLSWVTIITELSTTLFLYTTSTQTLSLGIYVEVVRGQFGTSAALATVLLGLTMLSIILLMRLPGGNKDLRV
ncbi:iron ABC transporter permease [Candidatus Aquiluna sp. UB-MaderosW2red]|uniref:ABC transporter permease n=1 Tax=Candidatus Aquiluna sp. UB-MaderosW2red TaxID=1855377 RepID=UPI000875BEFE|nr:iron ABC transporter permease [Candidatus Aquiluna sp. UB-MaderosW2red]SCX05950.1 iron(III) transport system permease protein [Candidatus Aquiluna sp. UB-MaderosW2red]